MPVPWSAHAPIFPFTLSRRDGGAMAKFDLPSLRLAVDSMGHRLVTSQFPPEVETPRPYSWAWAWLDDQEVLDLGAWVIWASRSWTRKPPKSYLEARLEQARTEWCREHRRTHCPRSVQEELRERIEAELTHGQVPKIEQDVIALNVQTSTVLLFNPNEAVRTTLRKRVDQLLDRVYGHDLTWSPWSLEEDLRTTRPHANLPAELGAKWLWWLAEHGLPGHALEVMTDQQAHRVVVILDEQARVGLDDGELATTGDTATRQLVERMAAGEEGRLTRLRLLLRPSADEEKADEEYLVTLDQRGHVVRGGRIGAKTINAKTWGGADAAGSIVLRIEEFQRLADLVRLLVAGYNLGPLSELLGWSPQAMLWPGATAGSSRWLSDWPPASLPLGASVGVPLGLFPARAGERL